MYKKKNTNLEAQKLSKIVFFVMMQQYFLYDFPGELALFDMSIFESMARCSKLELQSSVNLFCQPVRPAFKD